MTIQHEAFVNLYNSDNRIFNKLLDGVSKSTTLFNRIDKLSENFSNYGYNDQFKMKGDLFEIFGELYLRILGPHPTIGVYNFKPEDSVYDNGVDGTGIGIDGKPLTVQFKFRSNATDELIAEDLNQFGFQSIVKYGVDKDTKTNMVLFTCAKGLHYHTDNEVFANRIRTIGVKEIDYGAKGYPFWKTVADMIEATVKERYTKEIYDKFTPINI